MMLLFSDVLYMLVRYASPRGPMCLRCLMLTLSGLVELLFLLCFIAAWTCVMVSVMLVVCSLSVFLSMCLCFLCFMLDCVGELFVECVCCVWVRCSLQKRGTSSQILARSIIIIVVGRMRQRPPYFQYYFTVFLHTTRCSARDLPEFVSISFLFRLIFNYVFLAETWSLSLW